MIMRIIVVTRIVDAATDRLTSTIYERNIVIFSSSSLPAVPGRAEALHEETDLMDTPNMTVAAYIRDLFLPPDPQLEAALQRAAVAGLRSIQVSPEIGRLLGILVQATGARRRPRSRSSWISISTSSPITRGRIAL